MNDSITSNSNPAQAAAYGGTVDGLGSGYDDGLTARPWWSSSILVMALGVTLFISWAAYFEIDQSVRATGQIIPTARNQIVQVADGGVLAELLVSEGQEVSAGQRLAVLEKDRAKAGFEETRARVAALSIALMRAQAQARQLPPIYREEIDQFPEFVAAQLELYNKKKRALDESLELLEGNLDLAQQTLAINEELFENNDVSQVDVMNARAKVSEAQGKVIDRTNAYLEEALEESVKLETDLAIAAQKFNEKQDILLHTEIVAPVPGVVKYLSMNTLGAVVRPGDELVQISPSDSELIVEVRITPVDIGQLKLGLPASIAIDAFDPTIFGKLEGELIYLSSDTLTEQGAEGNSLTYYRAHVRVDEKLKAENLKFADIELRPGMTASVDIRTAKRTVLHYLGKPILRAFSGALTER